MGLATTLHRHGDMSFTKLLCPTDFSSGSQQALRVAARMAIDANAELVVVHAWYIPPSASAGEDVFPPHVIQEIVDDSQRGLDDAVSQATKYGAKGAESLR
jgi:hypothetical protein